MELPVQPSLSHLELWKFKQCLTRKLRFSHLQLLECEGGLARKRPFHIFKSWNSKGVSHESFLFTSSTGGIWMRSRTKVSFSHLQLLEFEGGLTRKFPFRIFNWWNLKEVSHETFLFTFNWWNLKEVSHESFLFTSSTAGIWRSRTKASFFTSSAVGIWRSRTKVSFSHLQLVEFEGNLAQKLRFYILNCWNLKEVSHESFLSHLQKLEFEGGLARKLPFHIFNCWNLKEVSHASVLFTSSTVGIWRRSSTKPSFSYLQLLEFEGGLARNLPLHIFNCWNFKVSHESFLFTSSTGGIWRRSRTKASFSHIQLLEFQGLARKFPFHTFNCWNLNEVSHESFLFTSSTAGIWRSRTQASFSHLQLLEFEGLARKLPFSHLQLLVFSGGLARNAFVRVSNARNAVFGRTERVSDDVWGSLSAGRFRNTFV